MRDVCAFVRGLVLWHQGCINSGGGSRHSDHPQRKISSAGFETRFDLDGPGELEVKTDAEATGRTARPYCRELAPNPRLCVGNGP